MQEISTICPICGDDVLEMDADQYFMVKDDLWYDTVTKAGYSPLTIICRDCFEQLLGRSLTEDDLEDDPIDNLVNISLRKKLKKKKL